MKPHLRSGPKSRRPNRLEAQTQDNLGIAWWSMPTGDKGENLRRAITAYEAALTIQTKDTDPTDWAMTQNDLGSAWRDMPPGDKAGEPAESLRGL